MYKPLYFKTQEFVSEETYSIRGERSLQLIDDRLLRLADYLREQFDTSVVINNWHYAKQGQKIFNQSGLRIYGQKHYRPYSQHSLGRALDMKFSGVPSEVVRQWLKDNAKFICKKFNIYGFTVEEGVSWLHIDLRNSGEGFNSFHP